MIYWKGLGELLLSSLRQARNEVLLAAPFLKQVALQRLLAELPGSVRLTVVTRWRPAEVAAGVSDVEVLELVEERGGTLFLVNQLHAKWYRADQVIIAGSANLTNRALGWHRTPNLEVLSQIRADTESIAEFEAALLHGATRATPDLAELMIEAAKALQASPPLLAGESEVVDEAIVLWTPLTRIPSQLGAVYRGDRDSVSSAAATAALRDLSHLGVPSGLSQDGLRAFIRAQLLTEPVFAAIDHQSVRPTRFGAMREHLADMVALQDRGQADRLWQTTMRWCLHFYPERYWVRSMPHSEVFGRRDQEQTASDN